MSSAPIPIPMTRSRMIGLTLNLFPDEIRRRTLAFADRCFPERLTFEVTRTALSLDLGPEAPRNLRVGLLSDFHYDPLREADFVRQYIAKANEQDLDLVLLLGDFASSDASAMAELAGLLSTLQSRHGSFAVLGNHDYESGARVVAGTLQEAGIEVLKNELQRLPVNGGSLCLAGLDCAIYGQPDYSILRHTHPGERVLVMAHEPDVFAHARRFQTMALQVSGHTHGGQVRLPVIGSPLLPKLGRRYVRGLHRDQHASLYVSRGLGTGHVHVRLNAVPEIAVLELRNTARA